jgi:hypothetical protein
METPCILVVIGSEHNVAEAQTVLALRPAHVVVLASKHATTLSRATRLADWIRNELPDAGASVLCRDMQGDDYAETVQHLTDELAPELARLVALHPHAPVWAMVSGGTKSTVIAVMRHTRWDAVVYKALEGGRLQVIDGPAASRELPTLSPLQHLKLYADIELAQANGQLPDDSVLQSALALWLASQSAQHPWQQLAQHPVGRAFFADLDPPASYGPAIPWPELPQLQDWWHRNLHAVAPQQGDALILPFPDPKAGRAHNERLKKLNRWLRGSWLEDVAVAWLLGLGISATNIEAGRKVRPLATNSAKKSENELDVVFAHKGRLWVIEAKYQVGKDMVQVYANQLSNQMNLVGRPNAALLLATPPPVSLLGAANTRDFRVLLGPEDLAQWIGLKPTDPV